MTTREVGNSDHFVLPVKKSELEDLVSESRVTTLSLTKADVGVFSPISGNVSFSKVLGSSNHIAIITNAVSGEKVRLFPINLIGLKEGQPVKAGFLIGMSAKDELILSWENDGIVMPFSEVVAEKGQPVDPGILWGKKKEKSPIGDPESPLSWVVAAGVAYALFKVLK